MTDRRESCDAEADDEQAVDTVKRAKAFLDLNDPAGALRLLATAMVQGGVRPLLLTAAANAWIAAVEGGETLADWPDSERYALHRLLILQEGCDASPPIFHHRIAAQHSGGTAGHLERAAKALENALNTLLGEPAPDPKAVLMGLLLRGATNGFDQERLSALHETHFAQFPINDLRIPYSVMFDRTHFGRNVADLKRYVRIRGASIVDGSVPLTHLLLLYWLVPAVFAELPPDWAERALTARRQSTALGADEAAAARSLALRFAIVTEMHAPALKLAADALAAARRTVAAEAASGDTAAIARLEQRPRQLAAVAINHARVRLPVLARLRRRPRIALCISGQLRGFRKAWATWRPLLAGVDATIFVSSWRRIGHGTPEPFRYVLPFEGEAFSRAYKAVGAELGLEGLQARYPRLFAALDRSGTVAESDLAALYRTPHVMLDDETQPAFAAMSNSEKMYHKIERCFQMASATGETFDLVVRLRPDKPVRFAAFDWGDMIAALRARPALYCETAMGVHYGAILMGDQVAIGLPQTSLVYAETSSRTPPIAATAPYRMEPHLWGHTSVAQLCWMNDIEVRKVPIKFGPFQEAEPLAARTIRDALAEDTDGRMDAIDRQLVAGNRADLGGSTIKID